MSSKCRCMASLALGCPRSVRRLLEVLVAPLVAANALRAHKIVLIQVFSCNARNHNNLFEYTSQSHVNIRGIICLTLTPNVQLQRWDGLRKHTLLHNSYSS